MNKINVADAKGNALHEKYIEAIRKSREPAVRDKLLEIVKATSNEQYFMAALPAIDRSHDELILEAAPADCWTSYRPTRIGARRCLQ